MPARQYYSSEALAETTTAAQGGAGGSDKLTLTFTPDANASYAIFCSAQASSDSATADYYVGIDIWEGATGSGTLKYGAGMRPKEFSSPQDTFGFFCCVAYTAPSLPSPSTWTMNYHASNGQTVRIKNARMVAIKLDPTHDFINYDYSDSSIAFTTSNAWADGLTLNFTPASSGDYLILAFGCMLPDVNNGRHAWRMNDGANNYGGWDVYNPDDNGGWTGCILRRYNGLSGSKTFKVQFQSPDGSTFVALMGATILALRIDQFEAVYESDSFTAATGNSTGYTDRLTLNFTPSAAVAHLAIATCAFRMQSTTVSGYGQAVLSNPSLSQEYTWEGVNTAGYNTTPGFAAVFTPSVAASSLKWQTRTETGTSNHTIDGQGLAVIQLAAVRTVTGSLSAAVQRALSASLGAAGAVQAARTGHAQLDAAVQTARTAQSGLDAAIRRALTTGLGAPAAVQQAAQATAALDAAIRRLTTLSLGADARIIAVGPHEAVLACDVAIRTARSMIAQLDAAVAIARQAGFAGDAAVAALRQSVILLSGAVQGGLGASSALDALIGVVVMPSPRIALSGRRDGAVPLGGGRETRAALRGVRRPPAVSLAGKRDDTA